MTSEEAVNRFVDIFGPERLIAGYIRMIGPEKFLATFCTKEQILSALSKEDIEAALQEVKDEEIVKFLLAKWGAEKFYNKIEEMCQNKPESHQQKSTLHVSR